ncbi:MAG: L-seryl-tRNA(Sec) selenium transferase [Dehalococcoidia bacterium]|nr:L-seryl-tRNA(Sec) selenium transferase [Dehalococcoidia bacterium]MDW8120160.1 L-seryl-tRNA(Sec) selenium transferase [Chloroflexota bacterium]
MSEALRSLPSVDRLMGHPFVQALVAQYQREAVVGLVRLVVEEARKGIGQGQPPPPLDTLAERVASLAEQRWRVGPRPVINATGVILHTNLGRAPLSPEAIQAMHDVARGYSDLEMDIEEGERGSRQEHVRHLLCTLTGAEDALVVNNNASAVLLGLAAVAPGKEVIVSRSEAVEIGGGFRIPAVLRQSGATLVEVGTTNRTYLSDYESALTPATAALLRVHRSNFRLLGFVHEPSLEELVALGQARGIPVLHDLGSGCLLPTEAFGLAHEPMPQESIRAGADLVFFSGDKLLGGPQAGLVVGKKQWVRLLARHPLARAVRIDKVSLAGLSATLLHYLKGEAVQRIPIWQMVARPLQSLEEQAHAWQKAFGAAAQVCRGESTLGGGSLPGETLPTWLVALSAEAIPGGAQELARRLRHQRPPVIARIQNERVVLDPRTVLPDEEEALVRAVRTVLGLYERR